MAKGTEAEEAVTPLLQQASAVDQQAKQAPASAPAAGKGAGGKAPRDAHEHVPVSVGWRGTCAWAGFIVLWYLLLQRTLASVVPSDPLARKELFDNIPLWVYHYSEAAFFTSSVLALVNLVFEDTADKQQLALLSFVIKGLSWHSDHLITTGRGVIKRDYYGALFLPSRYVQWSCSTPTMIFTISRISSLSAREVAVTMLADWLMVVCGWASSEMHWVFAVPAFLLAMVCFAYVQHQLWRMLQDAVGAADTTHSRTCLWFTLGSTAVVWNLFWIAWTLEHLGSHRLMVIGEALTIFSNFGAKVVFSTSIMYNNFVTLAERKRAAQAAKEHADRIQAVRDLTAAVKSRDTFLEVVGHELRTPLNAVLQLSSALAVGAAGAMSVQAREWLATIKASAGHLLGVVNDILTFRASQATTMQLNQELVAVGDVVDEVMRQLLPSAGPNIALEKVVHARLPPVVADRRRLALALSSLVANAIKFMDKPQGGVTVKAYPDRGARHVIIKVVDNGPGLTPTQLAQLSNPTIASQQLSGASGRKAGGLGLGLPITHQLMAAHGGVVRISSPGVGKGTTVLLRLPVLQAVTHPALRHDFSVAYTSLGYNLEQLLSPELAAAEGRHCPTFGQVNPPSPLSITSSSIPRPSMPLPLPPNMFVASSNLPSKQSIGSTTSSMDFGGSIMQHTYRWHPNLVASGTTGAVAPSTAASAALAAAAANNVVPPESADNSAQLPHMVAPDYNPNRPSEDSLAAWEAYADRMGYSLPTNAMPPEPITATALNNTMFSTGEFSMTGCGADRSSTNSAVASAKGVPGQAVALMSSLYGSDGTPPAAPTMTAAVGGFKKSKRSVRTNPASARDSIEECDEEGQEPEDCLQANKARDSVDVVHTPNNAATNMMGGAYRAVSDTSRGSISDIAATDALINAAAQASQVVSVAAMRLQTTVADLEAASSAALAADAAALDAARKANKQMGSSASLRNTESKAVVPQASEWDAYVGGGPANATGMRTEAEEVIANDARLSMQYAAALAQAQASHRPVEPQWETWVARIPEHHKPQDPPPA